MFTYDIHDALEEELEWLFKKDRQRYEIVFKKINEIISRNEITIEFYKNLKFPLNDSKRVHIDKSFVLLFKVFKKEKFILFEKLRHHDDVYK